MPKSVPDKVLPCGECTALSKSTRHEEPHRDLRPQWRGKSSPAVRVYMCIRCRSILINSLADGLHPWRYRPGQHVAADPAAS